MSYRSKHGITPVRRGKLNALSISRDFNFNPEKTYPVLLFTPHMDNTDEHFHIELNRAQALKLRDWLTQWLNDSRSTKR